MSALASQQQPPGVPPGHVVAISYGQPGDLGNCKTTRMSWQMLVARLTAEPKRSPETMAEFGVLPKEQRAKLKAANFYVGGTTVDGRRTTASFPTRTLVTLDIDDATPAFLDDLRRGVGALSALEYAGHTTRSSTPAQPRLRLVLPLAEPIPAEQHSLVVEGLAALIAEQHDGVVVDHCSTDAARLLYAPSLCGDAPHVAFANAGAFPDVDALADRGRAVLEAKEAAERRARAEQTARQARPNTQRNEDDTATIKSRWREVLAAMGASVEPSRHRRTEWSTRCRWHDDHDPSLDITDDGLMTCRACKGGGTVIDYIRQARRCDVSEAFAFAREALGMAPRRAGNAAGDTRETPSDEEPWGEPEAVPPPLLPVPAFDPEVLLPAVLRRWVMDEVNRMRCAPEFIAASVIAALGSVIGARCALKPKSRDDGWLVVPNVWGGLVGRPSTMKTPALSAALRPLGRLVAKAEAAYRDAMIGYDVREVVFKAKEEAITKEIQSAAKDPKADTRQAEIKLRLHREKGLEKPVLRRFKSNDATIEKLGEILRDNHNGLLVVRDELVGLLSRWDSKDGQEERTFFLEAWNGKESFDTDRIGRGHIFIPNLCLTVFGGIQPEKLLGHLRAQQGNNDGTFQRFGLLVYPDETSWNWSNDAADTQARDEAFKVFETLADFDPIKWGAVEAGGYGKFPTMTFAASAQDLFVEWLTEMRRERIPAEPDPLIQEHLGKYDGLFCQLAMTFHFVDCAANGYREAVSEDSALLAAAWCEFLESHARRCYGLLHHDGFAGAYALSLKIADGTVEDGFTARDIRRNRWKHLTTAEDVDEAIAKLIKREWLRPRAVGGTGKGSGRATTQYLINPDARSAGGAS